MSFLNEIFLWNWFPDFLGCLGTIIIIVTYFLLQIKKITAVSFLYSFLNFGGAFLILISLLYSWNMAAVIMEVAWILISFFGMAKALFPFRSKFTKESNLTQGLK